MIWFEIVLKLIGNRLDIFWKFVVILSDISLNKSSWNNWLVLIRG